MHIYIVATDKLQKQDSFMYLFCCIFIKSTLYMRYIAFYKRHIASARRWVIYIEYKCVITMLCLLVSLDIVFWDDSHLILIWYFLSVLASISFGWYKGRSWSLHQLQHHFKSQVPMDSHALRKWGRSAAIGNGIAQLPAWRHLLSASPQPGIWKLHSQSDGECHCLLHATGKIHPHFVILFAMRWLIPDTIR